MQYRQFGNTSLQVSEVGFGAWAIGGNAMIGNTAIGWGLSDDAVSKKAIHAALDVGINFFDTADIYGLGHSEQLLGKTLMDKPEVIIASKVGNVSRQNQFTFDYSASHIIDACQQSLLRLGRQVIDYYQLHTARIKHLENGECIHAMQTLQQQGKIRYWGLSLNTFHPVPEAEFLMEKQLGSGFQLVFNLINQRSLSLIKNAAAQGYGIVARMPLQFGLLTHKFLGDSTFENDDHRSTRLTKKIIELGNGILKHNLQSLCDKYQTSYTGLALSFIVSYPQVSTVIPGIRTTRHAIENTKSIVLLEQADQRLMEDLYTSDFSFLLDMIEKQG